VGERPGSSIYVKNPRKEDDKNRRHYRGGFRSSLPLTLLFFVVGEKLSILDTVGVSMRNLNL